MILLIVSLRMKTTGTVLILRWNGKEAYLVSSLFCYLNTLHCDLTDSCILYLVQFQKSMLNIIGNESQKVVVKVEGS